MIINKKYQAYINARKQVLKTIYYELTNKSMRNIDKMTDIELIKKFKPFEKKIIAEIESRKKHFKGKYYNSDLIVKNKIIKKLFPLRMVNSIRGIGKTYDMEQKALKEVQKGKQFLWLRLRLVDVEEYCKSEATGFFKDNEWVYKPSKLLVQNKDGEPVGYFLGLKTLMNAKGNKYPNVEKVFLDEFSVDGIKVENKWKILANFLTTIDRKDNPVTIIMCANYVNPYDEFLSATGLKQKEGDNVREQEFVFNWITGCVLWNIPEGFFKERKETWKEIGKRSSLVSYETYSSQYQSSFNRYLKFNIADSDIMNDIAENEIIIVAEEKYYMVSKLKNGHYLGYFIEQEFITEGTPIFGLEETDCIFDLRANLISDTQLQTIKELIILERFWFTNKKDYNQFVEMTDINYKEEPMFVDDEKEIINE